MKLGPRFIRRVVVIVAMAGLLLALQAASVPAAPPGAPPAQYGAVTCGNGGTCTTPVGTVGVGAGALPAGLTLDATTGAISGTPTTAGTANFTVQVTDQAAGRARQAAPVHDDQEPQRQGEACRPGLDQNLQQVIVRLIDE